MSTSEKWIPVTDFEGYYEVSNRGRVRSVARDVYSGRGRTRKHPMTMLSIYAGDHYSKVRLKRDGAGITKNVHQLVAEAFIGPRPNGDAEVCHNNGQHHDNRAENLRYDTHSSNSRDRVKHGTAYSRRTADECFNGHPYEEGSFYVDEKTGRRACLVCDRERHRRRVDKMHAEAGTVRKSERTECHYGHPLDGLSKRGKRFCKKCQNESIRRYRAKKKAMSAS